jgi:dTMP kinase
VGVAIGVVGLSAVQKRVPRERIFPIAVVGAGACMLAGACMSSLALAMAFVGGMGICAGTVYVVGFAILQEHVDDRLRGRIFAALYTMVRLCLLLALTGAPLISGLFDGLSQRWLGRKVAFGGVRIGLPGVRLTLWLGAAIILVAGVLAERTMTHFHAQAARGAEGVGA